MNCTEARIEQCAAGHQLPDHLQGPHSYRPCGSRPVSPRCVQRQVPMYLSTIVIPEFQVKQAINDLPLRNFVVLPFNVDHAMLCGVIIWKMARDPKDDRVLVKDDFKLLAE